MISELKDEEILDFLMTSDFEDDYSPSEFKYLLTKWRYFFRIYQGKYELSKTKSEGDIRDLNDSIKMIENDVNDLKAQLLKKQNLIDSIKQKKLTLRERLSGKIIINENEN